MKIVALYTIYNGLELLKKSIENIEQLVDEIVLCYQEKSNTGITSADVYPAVRNYINRPKFHVLNYEPSGFNTKEKESNKHNYMLEFAKRLNCTHFLFMATDHFYLPEEFITAKNSLHHDCSYTRMFTYYKHPTWQLTPPEDYYMPFICKLLPETKVVKCNSKYYPCRVDPALMINTCASYRLLPPEQIMLHHYSMIRNDIRNKFANAADSIRWSAEKVATFISEFEHYKPEENKGITYFGGRTVKLVPDYFGL